MKYTICLFLLIVQYGFTDSGEMVLVTGSKCFSLQPSSTNMLHSAVISIVADYRLNAAFQLKVKLDAHNIAVREINLSDPSCLIVQLTDGRNVFIVWEKMGEESQQALIALEKKVSQLAAILEYNGGNQVASFDLKSESYTGPADSLSGKPTESGVKTLENNAGK